MIALLVDDDENSRTRLSKLLAEQGFSSSVCPQSLQEGIELLEVKPEAIVLVVCNYRGPSKKLMGLFLQLSADLPVILCEGANGTAADPDGSGRQLPPITTSRGDEAGFLKCIEELKKLGILDSKPLPDGDLVRIELKNLLKMQKIQADIFFRLAPGRYCQRFRKEDNVSAEEL